MNKSTSTYLDFLRVFAAFGVLIVHAAFPWFSTLIANPKHDIGNKLVMIFFVLSGYLISFTVENKNKGAKKYLIDRFSRLYSVMLPALVLTLILDSIGKYYSPSIYITRMAPDHQLIRYLLNFTFLAQIWNYCTNPSTNAAFWSISYEFWYYIMFWVWVYLKGYWKIISYVIIGILLGPKIPLLLPVWVLGVLAFKYSAKPTMTINKYFAGFLFIGSAITVIYLIFGNDVSFLSKKFVYGRPPLFYSSNFILNWIYGLFVAINLWSFSFIAPYINIPLSIDKIIKKVSSGTFSLYLYHVPMLIFAGAIVPYDKSNYLQVAAMLMCIVFLIYVISEITEKKRYKYTSYLEKLFFLFRKVKSDFYDK